MSFEAQGKQTFWRDALGFLVGCPGGARKVREKKVCVQLFGPNCLDCLAGLKTRLGGPDFPQILRGKN